MPKLILLLSLLGWSGFADPLNESLEMGASVSQAYDARSTLVNPAALAFQTELNGTAPYTSFVYGINNGIPDEFSSGLSWGYFGFGMEYLSKATGKLRRYNFALAAPVGPYVFFGTRFVLQRPETALIGDYNGWDLGLQVRPSRYFSIGATANRLNQPDILGVKSPVQFVFGATVRPIEWLDLSFDADTLSQNFGKTWGYQATASAEIMSGLRLRAGYHKDYEWQAGLQWDFGNMSVFSSAQPSSNLKKIVSGVTFSPLPYRSVVTKLSALKITIDGTLSDEGAKGNFFADERPSLWSVIRSVDEAAEKGFPAIFVRLDSFPLGLASAQDLFDALARARERGVHIEVFLGNSGIKEYMIAAAAHRIHMEKSGTLATLGLKVEHYFLRGTLDKIGVEPEFLARGEYKSAPEAFMRKESSELSRKTALDELKEAEDQLVPVLARYRGIKADKWKKMLQHALFSAEEAKAQGLVDAVDDFTSFNEDAENKFVMREKLKEHSRSLSLPRRVAVVHASGDILQDRVGLLSLAGRSAVTPDRMERHFKAALNDPRTDAIVLRVNSGGGEILASEQIAALVEKAKRKKPLYVSMGDAAASGGYFIAAPGTKIYAQPLTLTGSIGVFLGKFSFAGLYKWLQLNKEILSHAPYPSLFSEHKPWGPAEKEILRRRMNLYYESFVAYVAQKRNLKPADAENAAKGRVWLGSSAKARGLVDDLGGYRAAVSQAAEASGLGADYQVWEIQDSPSLMSAFGLGALSKSPTAEVLSLLSPEALSEMLWIESLKENPFLYRASLSVQ